MIEGNIEKNMNAVNQLSLKNSERQCEKKFLKYICQIISNQQILLHLFLSSS